MILRAVMDIIGTQNCSCKDLHFTYIKHTQMGVLYIGNVMFVTAPGTQRFPSARSVLFLILKRMLIDLNLRNRLKTTKYIQMRD